MRGRYPLVTAHAGCLGTVPNSLANVRAALASGADIVEVDIRATRDGKVVLTHDDSIRLPGGGSAKVESLSWAEIDEAARSGGDGFVCLESLLDAVPEGGSVLNLDAKEHGALLAAAEVVRSRGREDSVIFSGLDESGIRLAGERLPEFRYLFNADLFLTPGAGLEGIALACRTARKYSCCGINLDWTLAGPEMMEYARSRCVPVMLWTVDDEQTMLDMVGLCPYSITTNRPDILGWLLA